MYLTGNKTIILNIGNNIPNWHGSKKANSTIN